MKKWLILGLCIGLLVAGWVVVRSQRFIPEWNKPKFAKVTVGDIRVPVSATGLIEPVERIEMKSKASGEVIEIRAAEGQFVHAGDVLVVLKRDDEQRSVDRAQADLDRVEALHQSAKVDLELSKLGVGSAEARLAQLRADERILQFDVNKKYGMRSSTGDVTSEEINSAEARLESNKAQQQAAEIDIQNARLSIQKAEQSVKLQDAAVRAARKSLEDAEERLRETTIAAPANAIVTDVNVRVGEVIQGGQSTFTGGTVLCKLADVSRLKVTTRVDEADFGRVMNITPVDRLPDMPGMRDAARADVERMPGRVGKVKLTVDAFAEATFEGEIERVEPQGKLQASIIQYDVHVVITDAKRHLLPLGTQAQVEFTVESASNVKLVPAEAVKTHEEKKGLWVKIPSPPGELYGKKFVPYRFGITDGTSTQLIEPTGDETVNEGDEVYTKLPIIVEEDE